MQMSVSLTHDIHYISQFCIFDSFVFHEEVFDPFRDLWWMCGLDDEVAVYPNIVAVDEVRRFGDGLTSDSMSL